MQVNMHMEKIRLYYFIRHTLNFSFQLFENFFYSWVLGTMTLLGNIQIIHTNIRVSQLFFFLRAQSRKMIIMQVKKKEQIIENFIKSLISLKNDTRTFSASKKNSCLLWKFRTKVILMHETKF